MTEKHEIVGVEMATEARLRISNQIIMQMQKLGYTAFNYDVLELGFELQPGWPVDMHAQPTLAQLVIVATKLGLRIVIGDMNLVPLSLRQDAVAGEDGS